MNKKILITGGCGFIGNNLSRYLLNKGYNIGILDNLSEGYKEWMPKSVEFKKIDIRDSTKVDKFISEFKPECVIHLAAMAAENLSHWIRKYCLDVNCGGTSNIVNSCVKHNIRKVIFTSSIARYGSGVPPFSEESPLNPEDIYGASKIYSEWDLKCASDMFGLEYSILVPHNITAGKYQSLWNPYRNVIGIFINNALNKRPLQIFGDGLQERAFSDIQYIVPVFEKLINDCNKEIFNIGADKTYKIIDVAYMVKRIAERYGYSTSVIHLPARKEVKLAHCNHGKAKEFLGFIDKTSLYEVIDEMFLWAEEQSPKEIVNYNYELDKNIYSCWKK